MRVLSKEEVIDILDNLFSDSSEITVNEWLIIRGIEQAVVEKLTQKIKENNFQCGETNV